MERAEASDFKGALQRILDSEKLKNCFECGICTASCSMTELLDSTYNPRELLAEIVLDAEKALDSEQLWLCAWCYRCHKRCPQALKLPEIFLLMREVAIKQGHTEPFEKALQRIVKNIPLPLVTAMVCFHPERAGLDREKTLGIVEQMLKQQPTSKKRKKVYGSEDKVAVIGSGPAGLTVASDLANRGYSVTIFESMSEAGGMLSKGIPEYRLPRKILTREIQRVKDLGVQIRTGVTIGKDLNFKDLGKQGFKAVFVGTGAHKNLKLKIQDRELKGVVYALDFLWNVNCDEKIEIGKNVTVIGGGNVAVDAARTALIAKTAMRMGAERVTILYRRSKEEMPANPWELKEAEQEGVKVEFLVSPVKILGENQVSAIECVRTQLGEPDESGRKAALPIEGSEFKFETDMVILAVGESPDLSFLPKEIEVNYDGTLWVNPITMETSIKGVFAGGDAVIGPASVIEAIRAGKHAAKSIDDYLRSRKR